MLARSLVRFLPREARGQIILADPPTRRGRQGRVPRAQRREPRLGLSPAQGREGKPRHPMAGPQAQQTPHGDKGKVVAGVSDPSPDALLREFMLDVSEARRVAECERVLGCFKLNPYEILRLWKQDESTSGEIRKQFRQVSLLVHPDKCTHKDAKQAFELVNKAYKDLNDEETKKECDATIRHAREELRRERKKATKKDNAYLAAAALRASQHNKNATVSSSNPTRPAAKETDGGAVVVQETKPQLDDCVLEQKDEPSSTSPAVVVPVGVAILEAEYEQSEGFQQELRRKTQELMTQLEWRRRQVGKRLEGEKQRLEKEEGEFREKMKKKVKEKNVWEKGREKRVSSWRDFAVKNKAMKKKKKKKKV